MRWCTASAQIHGRACCGGTLNAAANINWDAELGHIGCNAVTSPAASSSIGFSFAVVTRTLEDGVVLQPMHS